MGRTLLLLYWNVRLFWEDVNKTVFVTTCISPQALPPSPQPSSSAFPALDSLEMMAAMRAGSIPYFCPALMILDLYFSILPASVSAIFCDALTPLGRNQTQQDTAPISLSTHRSRNSVDADDEDYMITFSTIFDQISSWVFLLQCLPEYPSLSCWAVLPEAPVVSTFMMFP